MTGVSEQTRRNRVIAGKKAAAGAARRRDWRARSLAAVAEGVGAAETAAYRAPSIKSLLRRIRARQGPPGGEG